MFSCFSRFHERHKLNASVIVEHVETRRAVFAVVVDAVVRVRATIGSIPALSALALQFVFPVHANAFVWAAITLFAFIWKY